MDNSTIANVSGKLHRPGLEPGLADLMHHPGLEPGLADLMHHPGLEPGSAKTRLKNIPAQGRDGAVNPADWR